MLNINDSAPLNIQVKDQNGQAVSLKQLLGKKILLYFYPKDNTPGCTVEACNFRDANQQIAKHDIQIIGVSKDSVTSHQKFRDQHQLNFPLWSDPEHQLIEAFDALGEKKMMGKTYFGTIRSTFLINEKGKIIKTWPKVKAKDHSQEVLDFIEQKH